ncbi:Aste57867_15243 [Aphanomyces stellatus]|uniref:Aste57867_15243 protein n=1 Tax=Aphanomyces stellatus TaxID=120398 RepID=A0A485L4I2_9STRA|nr:hypothetical protein As57867_015187 [Aphanomyces stellatus]VFT92052.1 Aste57867_15243 [Aphanomyces stellatus]
MALSLAISYDCQTTVGLFFFEEPQPSSTFEPIHSLMPPTSPVDVVFRCPDLVLAITAFQDGLFADMLCFRRLKPRYHRPHEHLFSLDYYFRLVDQSLSPWYARYGLGRLPRLVHCLPHMRDVVVYHCVFFGRVDLLAPLASTFDLADVPGALVDLAAVQGHLTMLHALAALPVVVRATTSAMDWAASRGHLHVVMYLHAHRSEGCSVRAMTSAAICNRLTVVQWLHVHRTEGCSTMAMDWAAHNGHLEMVEWLHAHRPEGCTTRAMDLAALQGHVAVVAFLHAHRTEGCTDAAVVDAACRGHVDVVAFLTSVGGDGVAGHKGLHGADHVLDKVVANGHAAMARWLLGHGQRATWRRRLALEWSLLCRVIAPPTSEAELWTRDGSDLWSLVQIVALVPLCCVLVYMAVETTVLGGL